MHVCDKCIVSKYEFKCKYIVVKYTYISLRFNFTASQVCWNKLQTNQIQQITKQFATLAHTHSSHFESYTKQTITQDKLTRSYGN